VGQEGRGKTCAMSPLMRHIQRQANASIMAHQFPVACCKLNLSSATPAHEAKWPFRGDVQSVIAAG